MVNKLTDNERETSLRVLFDDGWEMVKDRDAIKKVFMFPNFVVAWSWMSSVALESEKHDHHPEWFNVYNRVEVTWSTHDVKGLSMLDVKMGLFCDNAFKKINN